MIPLLHGLSLLQNTVRANRITHFQPSTGCIISCVRSILASTKTLQRDAVTLQRFPTLAEERRLVLTVLASLVAQAKKAAEEPPEGGKLAAEVANMLRLGGQLFVYVRRFLVIAVQCGVELPDERDTTSSVTGSTDTQASYWSDQGHAEERNSPSGQTPTQYRHNIQDTAKPAVRMKSLGDLRNGLKATEQDSRQTHVMAGMQQAAYLGELSNRRRNLRTSSASTSSSSLSSQNSGDAPVPPPFPSGPSTAAQVMETLRFTHDQYLSTIAAFIGHAHSHSRTSHASSTGHLYDLVKEIVEMVCKLLTIVEAVMLHPDLPMNRYVNLKAAKEGLYNVTSSLADSVRLLTLSLPPTMSEEEEKQTLLRSATGALKAGADCVAAVKVCLNRSLGDRPFIINLPTEDGLQPFTPGKFAKPQPAKANSLSALQGYSPSGVDDEDVTIQAQTPSREMIRDISSGSDGSSVSKLSWRQSDETNMTSPDEGKPLTPLSISHAQIEPALASPTDDGTTWEGSTRHHMPIGLGEKIVNGNLPSVPLDAIPEYVQDPVAWLLSHDYSMEDVAYNSDGHLVGATMEVLVEKMTPHDSLVDPAFSAVFFLTFRLFISPLDLVDAIITRYNLIPPHGITYEDLQLWQQRKGIPVRLRVSNFIKLWVESYWRPAVDDPALPALTTFTSEGLAILFPAPAQRILDLLNMRSQSDEPSISPKGDRSRDPGMSINPPTSVIPNSEIPRPSMTKNLLVALRKKEFSSINVTDFDALELARQLTIMECNLYCAIQPAEILETGQEGATSPVNVRAVSSLSTAITGWVAESILSEPDIKKRTLLIKFFIKVAEVSLFHLLWRIVLLNLYSDVLC